jgi:nitrite reductase (NADH) large subunit
MAAANGQGRPHARERCGRFFLGRSALAAVLREHAVPEQARDPVVIVGAGPVGVRVAQQLARRDPARPIVLYGAERSEPYNRVRLTSFLAGELGYDALTRDLQLPESNSLVKRYGCAVVAIARKRRAVVDARGRMQPFGKLVLATGSRPYVPNIPGISRPNVFTFRDFDDAQRLFARSVRSRCTVVLGGGLLGLEAARAMRRYRTDVVVIEQEGRLMPRELDKEGAARLRAHVERLGIEVVSGDGVRRALGEERVQAVQLRSGRCIDCDTVIVAAGIRPNVELALRSGLAVGRGIRVDDRMRTNDPDILAVGECAEHRGIVYGLVAPGLEQAAVAASQIAGMEVTYPGSVSATRLKVLSLPVFSIGRVREGDKLDLARMRTHRGARAYGKIVTERGRLIGALAVGELPELGRLQEAVMRSRRILPWEAWRFARTGSPWPKTEGGVAAWPDAVAVCNCTGVTRGELGRAIAGGCASVEALARATGASAVCGSCRPLLVELTGTSQAPPPVRGSRTLLTAGIAALVLVLLASIASLPYADTVTKTWDVIWRESAWKQASGFTVLGLSLLALVLSLRKRWFKFGDFALWRVAHAVVAALCLAGLAAHTGGRLGANLDFLLVATFLGVIALGALAGGLISLEHRLGARGARLRRAWTWAHLLVFWPVPVLLGVHVFKSYYF